MNKKIYKVTQTQLSSLQSNGFITVDGVRYDYDPNSLYILADPFAPEYRLETQGHNLHLLKDNVIISDLTVPFAQASVYASNAKNLQNKTGSKAYTYYDILPRVDYKDFLLIKDLPMEGILCGIVRNGYFYKVREEGTNTDIPFTLFCQTVDGYYSLSTSEITTPIEGYTIHNYFNEAKFTPYGTVKKVNNTEPDADGNVTITIPLQIENIKDGTGNGSLNQIKDGTGTTFSIDDSSGNSKNPNAYALDNTIKGDIVFGGVGDYSTSLGGKSSAQGKRSVAQGTTTIAKGNYSHAEGDNSVALGPDSHAEGYATVTYGKASHSEGTSTQALGEGSHAEGSNTKATKTGAHSEGEETDASGYASHTEGLFNKVLSEIPAYTGGSGSGITPPPSTGWNIDEHRGDAGHAEGYGNVVYGFASHAEGHQNKSSGHYSHSEGLLNTASGNYSHAEGTGCLASDTGAHAGGSYCYAITSNAFAHGQSLTTNIPNQAVFGEYNLDLPFSSRETQYLFAIGNGTDVNHRSNAFVSYKDGRAAIGKDPVNDLDVATKGYVDRIKDNFVPYTGAIKDVNLGEHSFKAGGITVSGDTTADYINTKKSNIDITPNGKGVLRVSDQYGMVYGDDGRGGEMFTITMKDNPSGVGKVINHITGGASYVPTSTTDLTPKKYVYGLIGKLQIATGSDWEFLDLIAEKTFSKAFTEVKPGKSGIPNGNATVDVTTTTWQKKINGAIVGYKTIVDVTCRCEQFNLKDVGLNVLLSKVGSRWFMPRMAVSRGNIQSGKFTKMMDRLNAQKDRVGILVDEVSIFRDATTNLGCLNVNGGIMGQITYDYAEFRVFAIMLELDKDHEGESIPCTGAHYRIVMYHPQTILA